MLHPEKKIASQQWKKHFQRKQVVNRVKSDREAISFSNSEVTGNLREDNFSGMWEAKARLPRIEAWMRGEEVEIVVEIVYITMLMGERRKQREIGWGRDRKTVLLLVFVMYLFVIYLYLHFLNGELGWAREAFETVDWLGEGGKTKVVSIKIICLEILNIQFLHNIKNNSQFR